MSPERDRVTSALVEESQPPWGINKYVAHIVSECEQFAQNEYKKYRHDKVAASLHWNMCKNMGSLAKRKCMSTLSRKKCES